MHRNWKNINRALNGGPLGGLEAVEGWNPDELKQRIEEFYRDIREHERKQWLDRQELERERREVERELEQADLDEVLEAFNG